MAALARLADGRLRTSECRLIGNLVSTYIVAGYLIIIGIVGLFNIQV